MQGLEAGGDGSDHGGVVCFIEKKEKGSKVC